jgi:TRAP-type transport system periplasmic protein
MKKVKRSLLVLLAVIVCITFAFTACAPKAAPAAGDSSAAKPIVLRMATDHPIEHMATRSANAIVEEVKTKTNGRVEITLYPASQLGDYNTVYEEIVRGTIDIGHITIPDSLDPRLGSAYTPYLTTGYDEAKKVYAPGSFLYNKFVEYNEKLGVRFLGFYLEGYIGMGTKKEPKDFLEPGKDKEMKVRVWAAPASRAPMTDLGYTAITVPYAEAPTAIQTGVVDGWIGGTPNVNFHWVGEVIKYFYVTHMHAESTAYVMSNKTLAKISPEDQKVIVEAFSTQSNASFDLAKAEDEKWIAELEKKGVKVTQLTDAQVQSMADYVRTNTWPKLEELYTKELLDGLKAQYK